MNEIKQAAPTIKNSKLKIIDLVMTGMFTAVICVLAPIAIPIQPIPFTLSLFAVFLTGALLEPRYAFLSAIVYLLLGVVGLPVFAGAKSGPQVLTGMTGGYLVAYPLMTLVTSLFYKFIKKYKVIALACGMLTALLICYVLGTLWFSSVSGTGFGAALSICVFPYAPFDALKIILAISVSMVIRKTVYKSIGM